jgi:phosphoserine phosphatase RsbU/P
VKVAPNQTGLALAEVMISSAFEIYVNGQRIMQTGRVAPFVPYTYNARLVASIPDRETATGSLVIALRVHISRWDWDDPDPGLFAANLTLGQEHSLWERIWLIVIGLNALTWLYQLFGIGLGIVALALFAAQRRQWEYLWIFLQFAASACRAPLTLIELFHTVPANWDLLEQPLLIAGVFFSILMYYAFLRLRFGWWIRAISAVAALGLTLSVLGQSQGNLPRIAAGLTLFPLAFLTAGVIPVLLVIHFRRGNREAGILLIPIVLFSLAIYAGIGLTIMAQFPALKPTALALNNIFFNLQAGPFVVNLIQIGGLFYILSLAIIMVLRSTRVSRQQALLESELAAAREVQQVILPDKIEAVPGFTFETIYQPAQQVGGDFFQILPDGQGGLLLVIGDVAGKGLPAAMLVSVLVGAIRTVAEFTRDPAELLASLNERLIGRVGTSFATALVAHISVKGYVTIANAGHLSPYLDGREILLPGALPLGIQSGIRYETIDFYLAPESRLTFYSDGVVEAQNQAGELLGFDRGRELSTQPAAAIVEAAKQFGQQDDITVVIIERASTVAQAA